jgi:hypothetical protein
MTAIETIGIAATVNALPRPPVGWPRAGGPSAGQISVQRGRDQQHDHGEDAHSPLVDPRPSQSGTFMPYLARRPGGLQREPERHCATV